MHVAVAIVGYRNAGDVLRCIECLARSTYSDFEVVICENGGADAFERLVSRLPNRLPHGQEVRVLQAGANLGYAGGVNTCIHATLDADAWWVLNPDTEPDSDALAALVARLSQGDCAVVGGILYGSDGRVQTAGGKWRPWLARAESLGRGRAVSDPPNAMEIESRLKFISGASMLVSRSFHQAVGPMRDDYFLYAEEVEWCLRGVRCGMRLGFAPEARVLHRQGGTTGSALEMRMRPRLPIYLDERNKLLVTHDHYPARLPIAAAASLLLLGFRYLGKGAWRQFTYGLAGWLDGLLQQRGRPLS